MTSTTGSGAHGSKRPLTVRSPPWLFTVPSSEIGGWRSFKAWPIATVITCGQSIWSSPASDVDSQTVMFSYPSRHKGWRYLRILVFQVSDLDLPTSTRTAVLRTTSTPWNQNFPNISHYWTELNWWRLDAYAKWEGLHVTSIKAVPQRANQTHSFRKI